MKISTLTKSYGKELILRDIHLVVTPGERLGVIGPNGCGKTTLLRIIAGNELPDSVVCVSIHLVLRWATLLRAIAYAPKTRWHLF